MNLFPMAYLVQRDGKDVILPARTMSVFEAFATQYGRKPLFNIPFYKDQEAFAWSYTVKGEQRFTRNCDTVALDPMAPYPNFKALYMRPEEPVVFGMTQADIEKFMQCDDEEGVPKKNKKSFLQVFEDILDEAVAKLPEKKPVTVPYGAGNTDDAHRKNNHLRKENFHLSCTVKTLSTENSMLALKCNEARLQRDDALAKLNAANEKLERVRLAILKANNG